jgi:hypothetical protein
VLLTAQLTGSLDRNDLEDFSGGAQACIAMNLNWKLRSSGVRVCSLTTGDPDDFQDFPYYSDTGGTEQDAITPEVNVSTVHTDSSDTLDSRTTYHTAVCDTLKTITAAR